MNRLFAISDIHGSARTFQAMLDKIGLNKEDELFLIGDFIDRGPNSKGVLDKIMSLQEEGYQLYCMRGNHEQMMLEAPLSENYAAIWLRNGGREVLEEFDAEVFSDIPSKYYEFLDELHYLIERDNRIFVHAGFKLGTGYHPFEMKQPLLWIRKWEEQEGVDAFLNGREVVHGHCPQTEEAIRERFDHPDKYPILNIDNGCAYDREGMKQLCCVELNFRSIYFQKNIDF